MGEIFIDQTKKNIIFSIIIFMFILLLLWYYVKNEVLFKNGSVDGFEVDPGKMVNYSGVNTLITNYKTPIDYTNINFVSGIHDYYPPFTKVINNGDGPYIPIRNTNLDYFAQNLKFR